MMAVVAYNEELAERVREALADRTDVEEKKMFGGLSFMVAGQMCCGVLKNDLIVRIEPTDFRDPGCRTSRPVLRLQWAADAGDGLRECQCPERSRGLAGVDTARDRLRGAHPTTAKRRKPG
jgi:TfoX-like protein